MSCIRGAYDLGAAPARYLCSEKKEESYAASILKTTAAIALLVPGILLAVSSFVLNMLISPCCGSQFKGRVTSQPKEIEPPLDLEMKKPIHSASSYSEPETEEPQIISKKDEMIFLTPDEEISLLANLSKKDWEKWGEELAKLEKSLEVFASAKNKMGNYFDMLPKSGPRSQDEELSKGWYNDTHNLFSAAFRREAKMNHREYVSFPYVLKDRLSAAIKGAELPDSIAEDIYENRENFLNVFNEDLNQYYQFPFKRYFDLFNQEELKQLKPVHQAFCEAVLHVWLAMRDLYAVEKNAYAVAMCERRAEELKTFSKKLQSKIEQHLSSE